MIPFYMTDCDMHERLWMRKFRIEGAEAGRVWDVHSSLDNLEQLYKRGDDSSKPEAKTESAADLLPREPKAQRNSADYGKLVHSLNVLQDLKSSAEGGRNTWQARQRGGQGEPFYRDPEGFEKGILMWMDFGRDVFTEKWGRGPCDLRVAGLEEQDAWYVNFGVILRSFRILSELQDTNLRDLASFFYFSTLNTIQISYPKETMLTFKCV